MRKIQQISNKILMHDQVIEREMARFVGKAVATVHTLPMAPLHYRAIQFKMNVVPSAWKSSVLVQHKGTIG